MLKIEAIDLLGGDMTAAAEAMDISYQAVNKWPECLPRRISDRILGVCLRRGIDVPTRFLDRPAPAIPTGNTPPALASQAQGAINSEAKEAAHA